MNAVRTALLGLSLVLMFGLADAAAQFQKKGFGKLPPPELITPEVLDQLSLTAQQKKWAGQLQDEFATRVQQSRMQMRPMLQKARMNEDKDAFRKARSSMQLATDQIRQNMDPRFQRILTATQRKKYAELKKKDAPVVAKGRPGLAPGTTEAIKGTIKKLDPDQGTLLLTVNGKDSTYQVSRATKVLDDAGKELPNGLSDKALASGVEVSIIVNKQGRFAQRTSVTELKLAGK